MKPRLLICNDDGIDAPGIQALYDALKDIADIVIAAPAFNQSSTGASSTLYNDLHAEKVNWENGVEAWKIFGTPVDCVKIALEKLLPAPPDLLVSGINYGGNQGKNVLYSGTIATTIHANFHGIPGIAFSQIFGEESNKGSIYDQAKLNIPTLVNYFLRHPTPQNIVMSVNFPYISEGYYKGIKVAKQGGSYWKQSVEEITSTNNKRIFKHTAVWIQDGECEQSDTSLLNQGYVTITPIRIHELTDEDSYQFHQEKFYY
jgi:5'-nucleotidase